MPRPIQPGVAVPTHPEADRRCALVTDLRLPQSGDAAADDEFPS